MSVLNQYFWNCNVCAAQNSREDGVCQFCECGGHDCLRDNCDGPECRVIASSEGGGK